MAAASAVDYQQPARQKTHRHRRALPAVELAANLMAGSRAIAHRIATTRGDTAAR